MRQRFLTVYDYGTGGVWQWITADSSAQILAKYPKLRVFAQPPAWWEERSMPELLTYDIDDEPDNVLAGFGGT